MKTLCPQTLRRRSENNTQPTQHSRKKEKGKNKQLVANVEANFSAAIAASSGKQMSLLISAQASLREVDVPASTRLASRVRHSISLVFTHISNQECRV